MTCTCSLRTGMLPPQVTCSILSFGGAYSATETSLPGGNVTFVLPGGGAISGAPGLAYVPCTVTPATADLMSVSCCSAPQLPPLPAAGVAPPPAMACEHCRGHVPINTAVMPAQRSYMTPLSDNTCLAAHAAAKF